MRFTLGLLALAGCGAATIYYAGVAESGGEFGVQGSKGKGLPGNFGTDYKFLDESTLDTWIKQDHINVFRIALLLERMCPLASGLGKTFDPVYFGHFDDAVKAVTSKGAYAIIDPHNYMRYNDPSNQPGSGSVIGDTSDSDAATTQQFQEFWTEMASRYVNNEKVIFGIMNEPHDMNTALVLRNNQAAIDGIRSTGAKQLILAPGNLYTGGHSWTNSWPDESSATAMANLKDIANNLAFDVHEYLDADFSGTHEACSQPYTGNMDALTSWLKQHGFKAFISEFGVTEPNAECNQLLTDALNYMAQNPEYIGWTYWAAGPLWGSGGSVEPGNPSSYYDSVWKSVVQPLLPKSLQTSGISSAHGGNMASTSNADLASKTGGSDNHGDGSGKTSPYVGSLSTKPAASKTHKGYRNPRSDHPNPSGTGVPIRSSGKNSFASGVPYHYRGAVSRGSHLNSGDVAPHRLRTPRRSV